MAHEDPITLVDCPPSPEFRQGTFAPYLFVALECDRPLAGGARYALSGIDELMIGRGVERQLTRNANYGLVRGTLRVPGRWISATHARLCRSPEGWVLEDTGSTNGVFLGGKRVTRALLCDGDVFELGHTLFVFREALHTPGEFAPDFDSRRVAGTNEQPITLLPTLEQGFANLALAARSTLPITLLGETGTGKEVVARTVHQLSRRPGAFVAVNCGALAPNLVESLLFGHVKGAFSGALRDEPGFFRAAEQGTLLLDEIGDLPLAAQPALLRALQEREIVPVGASRAIKLDVRVIAATHRPIDTWSTEHRFRADLLARLAGYRMTLPPLQDRREDIGVIIAQAFAELARADPAAAQVNYQFTVDAGLALLRDAWPWNLRELVQHLRRGVVLAPSPLLTRELLGLDNGTRIAREPHALGTPERNLDADLNLKRELVSALETHGGNVTNVARAMGKKRMQIHRWLRRFELQPKAFRGAGH